MFFHHKIEFKQGDYVRFDLNLIHGFTPTHPGSHLVVIFPNILQPEVHFQIHGTFFFIWLKCDLP